MSYLRLALNQIDTTVGDIAGNGDLVVRWARHAAERGAHLVAFPEMALTGYPVEDLALRPSFVDASRAALTDLAARLEAEGLGSVAVVVGYLGRSTTASAKLGLPVGSPQNCAALLYEGKVVTRLAKHHLPNYGVFDEFRYFVPGDTLPLVRLHGVDVALAICEDIWQDGGRVQAARQAGAGLLLVVNASPYEADKDDARLELSQRRAAEAGCTLAYVNQVGGQDELVFDGDSAVVTASGEVLARAPQFEEDCLLLDLELPQATGVPQGSHFVADGLEVVHTVLSEEPLPEPAERVTPGQSLRLNEEEEIYGALVTGLRAYIRKNGFTSALIGLSGGIDSALVAALAVDAIGAENVHCVSMPSAYSSQHSRDDAAELARRTGLHFRTVSIAPMFDAYMSALHLTGLAEENLQARVRGTTLMGLSNAEGHLVLATGNYARQAGRLLGLNVPAIPVEHQYIVYDESPELKAYRQGGGRELAVLRESDQSYYLREERMGWILGPYEKGAPARFADGVPDWFGRSLFEGDLDRLLPHVEAAQRRVPSLELLRARRQRVSPHA